MNTSIAAGVAAPVEDAEIVQAMVMAGHVSGASSRATGVQQLVGVRNDATGIIYRNALFKSRMQVLRLAQRLARLGYADELAGHAGRSGGFDAIFSRAAARVGQGSVLSEAA